MGFFAWNQEAGPSDDCNRTLEKDLSAVDCYQGRDNYLNDNGGEKVEDEKVSGWGWYNPLRNMSLSEVASAFVVYEDIVDDDDQEIEEVVEDDKHQTLKFDLSDKLLSKIESEVQEELSERDLGMAVHKGHEDGSMKIPKVDCLSDSTSHSSAASSSSESSDDTNYSSPPLDSKPHYHETKIGDNITKLDKTKSAEHFGTEIVNSNSKVENEVVVGEQHSHWLNLLRHVSLDQISSAFVSYEDEYEEDVEEESEEGSESVGEEEESESKNESSSSESPNKGTNGDDNDNDNDNDNDSHNDMESKPSWFAALTPHSISQVASALFSYESEERNTKLSAVEEDKFNPENAVEEDVRSHTSSSILFGTLTIIEEDAPIAVTTSVDEGCSDNEDTGSTRQSGEHFQKEKSDKTQNASAEVETINMWYMLLLGIFSNLKKKVYSKKSKGATSETGTAFNDDSDEEEEEEEEEDLKRRRISEISTSNMNKDLGAAPAGLQ